MRFIQYIVKQWHSRPWTVGAMLVSVALATAAFYDRSWLDWSITGPNNETKQVASASEVFPSGIHQALEYVGQSIRDDVNSASETQRLLFRLSDVYPQAAQPSLLEPTRVLPDSTSYKRQDLLTLLNFSRTCAIENRGQTVAETRAEPRKQRELDKAWHWETHQCEKPSLLRASFFESPPFIHPFGGSFAWRALQLQRTNPRPDEEPIDHRTLVRWLHVSELRAIAAAGQSPAAEAIAKDLRLRFLAELDDNAVRSLRDESVAVIGRTLVAVKLEERGSSRRKRVAAGGDPLSESVSGPTFALMPRDQFAKMLARRGFRAEPATSIGTSCTWLAAGICWNSTGDELREVLVTLTVIAAVLLLVGALLDLRRRNARVRLVSERERAFLLNSLTHEIRTPAATIRVALENMRRDFDDWSPETQSEFLRLCNESTRMSHVIARSETLARAATSGQDKELGTGVHRVQIDSLRDLVLNEIERLDLPESVLLPGEDVSCVTDPFWTAVCVRNLLDNARRHGAPPIKASVTRTEAAVEIKVTDNGGSTAALLPESKQRSPGLGFGLSLVRAAATAMGGRLISKQNPTQFKLELPT